MSQVLQKMTKVSTVFLFALALTMASLYLMQLMILSEEVPETTGDKITIGNITLPELDLVIVRDDPRPEPIEEVEIDIEMPPPPDVIGPTIDVGPSIYYEPEPSDENRFLTIEHTEALALSQTAPTYPSRALQRGIEGYVLLEFDIDEAGRVINPRVLDAEPEGVFERAALNAIERWRFQPKVADGAAVVKRNERRMLSFTIEE